MPPQNPIGIDWSKAAQPQGLGIDWSKVATPETELQDPSGRTSTGEPAPGDTRNSVQRYLDNLTTPDPRREEWQSPFRNGVDDFAQHVASSVVPLISHPLNSAKSLINTIAGSGGSPAGIGEAMVSPMVEKAVEDYQEHGPIRGTTDLIGTGVGMGATGELGGTVLKAARPVVGKVGEFLENQAPAIGKTAGYGVTGTSMIKNLVDSGHVNPLDLLYSSKPVTSAVEGLSRNVGGFLKRAGTVPKIPQPFQTGPEFPQLTAGTTQLPEGSPAPDEPANLVNAQPQVVRGKGGRMTKQYTAAPSSGQTQMNPGPAWRGPGSEVPNPVNIPAPQGESTPPVAPTPEPVPLTKAPESTIVNSMENSDQKPLVETNQSPKDMDEKALQQDLRDNLEHGQEQSDELGRKLMYQGNKVYTSRKTGAQGYNPGDTESLLPWAETPWGDTGNPEGSGGTPEEYNPPEGASASMKVKPKTQNFINPFHGGYEPDPKFSADELNDLYRSDVLDTMGKTHNELVDTRQEPKSYTDKHPGERTPNLKDIMDSQKGPRPYIEDAMDFIAQNTDTASPDEIDELFADKGMNFTKDEDIIKFAKDLGWKGTDKFTGKVHPEFNQMADDLDMPNGEKGDFLDVEDNKPKKLSEKPPVSQQNARDILNRQNERDVNNIVGPDDEVNWSDEAEKAGEWLFDNGHIKISELRNLAPDDILQRAEKLGWKSEEK